jgi:hypothetical protein
LKNFFLSPKYLVRGNTDAEVKSRGEETSVSLCNTAGCMETSRCACQRWPLESITTLDLKQPIRLNQRMKEEIAKVQIVYYGGREWERAGLQKDRNVGFIPRVARGSWKIQSRKWIGFALQKDQAWLLEGNSLGVDVACVCWGESANWEMGLGPLCKSRAEGCWCEQRM